MLNINFAFRKSDALTKGIAPLVPNLKMKANIIQEGVALLKDSNRRKPGVSRQVFHPFQTQHLQKSGLGSIS